MKLLFITDKEFPPEPRIYNEAYTLVKAGVQVTVLALTISDSVAKEELLDDIRIIRIKCSKPIIKKLWALAFTLPFLRWYLTPKIVPYLSVLEYDIIHLHNIILAPIIFRYNVHKRPIVLDIHENLPEIIQEYPHYNTILGQLSIFPSIWRKMEKYFIKKADLCVVVADEAKDFYVKHFQLNNTNFLTLPNTVLESFYKNPPIDSTVVDHYKDSYVLLYLGDTGLRRGLPIVISVLPDLIKLIPNLKLVIAGRSRTDDVLKEQAKQLNVAKHIDFLGWIDNKLFPSYISLSKICLCPLARNKHHDTTYANKIFQYMSFGKPTVMSNCTSQKNLVNQYNCGLIFEDGDKNGLLSAIISLYSDEELYNTISKNSRVLIENQINWEKLKVLMIDNYNKLLTNG
jgi:glycosyltransferase involved in cell wall biosynthesis